MENCIFHNDDIINGDENAMEAMMKIMKDYFRMNILEKTAIELRKWERVERKEDEHINNFIARFVVATMDLQSCALEEEEYILHETYLLLQIMKKSSK